MDEYISREAVLDKLAIIYDLARTDQKAPISCAISDIKSIETKTVLPVISGDNCIVCGHNVLNDDMYYDLNGGTICEACMNTKYEVQNGR